MAGTFTIIISYIRYIPTNDQQDTETAWKIEINSVRPGWGGTTRSWAKKYYSHSF